VQSGRGFLYLRTIEKTVHVTTLSPWASSTIRYPRRWGVSIHDLDAKCVADIFPGECKKTGKILASFVDPRQSFGPDKIIPPEVLARAKVFRSEARDMVMELSRI